MSASTKFVILVFILSFISSSLAIIPINSIHNQPLADCVDAGKPCTVSSGAIQLQCCGYCNGASTTPGTPGTCTSNPNIITTGMTPTDALYNYGNSLNIRPPRKWTTLTDTPHVSGTVGTFVITEEAYNATIAKIVPLPYKDKVEDMAWWTVEAAKKFYQTSTTTMDSTKLKFVPNPHKKSLPPLIPPTATIYNFFLAVEKRDDGKLNIGVFSLTSTSNPIPPCVRVKGLFYDGCEYVGFTEEQAIIIFDAHVRYQYEYFKKNFPSSNILGGCVGTRFGCCWDAYTPRIDPDGTNCPTIPDISLSGGVCQVGGDAACTAKCATEGHFHGGWCDSSGTCQCKTGNAATAATAATAANPAIPSNTTG